MSGDEEILSRGSDLYKHLLREGYSNFETYNSDGNDKLYQNSQNCMDNTNTDLVPLSCHDHTKLMIILNSKLLLSEDVELLELILLNTSVKNNRSTYYLLSGTITASLVCLSSAVFLKNRVNVYFSLGFGALGSVYSLWQLYKNLKRNFENKALVCHIDILQKLCLNIHKLLRFLKETEILSTANICTFNIGSAMYIPVDNRKELNNLPNWKTLPHVRKCVVDALVDAINIFSLGCASVRQSCPTWMNVRGYELSSHSSLKENLSLVKDLSSFTGCISIKDLQMLNNTYLVVQSEYLRLVALCLCPDWENSVESMDSSKVEVYKILEGTKSKLSEISFKLKMQYNFQHILPPSKGITQQKSLGNNFREMNNMQIKVHNIFLQMLAMIMEMKNLEDCFENIADSDTDTDISNLMENIAQQLHSMKDNLASVIKSYEDIYYQIGFKRKPQSSAHDDLQMDSKSSVWQLEPKSTEIDFSLTEFSSQFSDEVFLATSEVNKEENTMYEEDWGIDKKPQIPKTLLKELSTTLKSIKKDFKERERLALERVGLKDFENDLDTENDGGSDSESSKHSHYKNHKRVKRRKHSSKRTDSNSSNSSNKENISQVDTTLTLNTTHSSTLDEKSIVVDEKCIGEIDTEDYFSVSNSSTLAHLVAMKSRSWGTPSEECYTDG